MAEGRIICLDYGKKRTGIAVTDPLRLIATALETVDTGLLIGFLKTYFKKETVTDLVIGYPLNLDGSPTDATAAVEKFIGKFGAVFPDMPVHKIDERFSSKMAGAAIREMGLTKKDREEKGRVDTVAAVILLQDYLGRPA